MPTKSVQLSTRVTDEDASFLAALPIEGVHTPSDKIRALIRQARERSEGLRGYESSLRFSANLFAPIQHQLRSAENQTGMRSEFVHQFLDWLLEALAFALGESPNEPQTGRRRATSEALASELEAFEKGLVERVLTLVELPLRMGITDHAPCYESSVISERMDSVLDLAHVLRQARQHAESPTSK